MFTFLTILCLIAALALLIILSIIDLRVGLLPNVLVLPLALTGLAFHYVTGMLFITPTNIALGALIGGGSLLAIRTTANAFYGEDTLGLGDVKLLAAGGLWLGPEHTLMAIGIGAAAGLLHGTNLAIYTAVTSKQKIDLSRFSIPAGPGFAVGIVIAAILKFQNLPAILLP